MLKKEPSRLVQLIRNAEKSIKTVLAAYLNEYAQFGIDDDVATDLINIQANMEAVRLEVQYAQYEEE